jgi:hypothetical protein
MQATTDPVDAMVDDAQASIQVQLCGEHGMVFRLLVRFAVFDEL